MNIVRLEVLIQFVIKAHSEMAKDAAKTVRTWDKKTPYYIHTLWCAMTILTEENLSEAIRWLGAQVLLLHDVPEDTKVKLPAYIETEVVKYVEEMIFTSSADEMKHIWNKRGLTKLFKLYDKVSNMLDSSWMLKERGEIYYEERIEYLEKLTDFAEEGFGQLNIVVMARTVAVKCRKQLEEERKRDGH